MFKKIVVLVAVVIMSLGILTACTDYGYEFHFDVIGEHGTVSIDGWDEPSPVFLLGGKNGHQLKFIATPESGYQVKEWIFNGEKVEDNKSNSFAAKVDSYKQNKNTITVEFEPIS